MYRCIVSGLYITDDCRDRGVGDNTKLPADARCSADASICQTTSVNAQSTKEIEQILKKVKAYNFPCCCLVELLALGLCWRRGVVVSGVRQ